MNPDKRRPVEIGNCLNKRSHRYQRSELRGRSAPMRTKPGLVLRRTYPQVQIQRSFLKARTEHIVAIRARLELAVSLHRLSRERFSIALPARRRPWIAE